MLKAPIPLDEIERLEKLYSYQILNTAAEKAFDEITELAAMICGTKISLVSLIDENRQWFKSRHGLDASETPREISFCGHAIMGDDIFIVEDAEKDERFKDNPLFTGEPNVRFYAGYPLKTPEGYRVGTLCVIDAKTKTLARSQKMALEKLANTVVRLLEMRNDNKKLQDLSKQYLNVQKIVKAGDWELDIKTDKSIWSESIYDIYALPYDTPIKKVDAISYYAPHERAKLTKLIEDCITHQTTFSEKFEFIDAKGCFKWVHSTCTPITDEKNAVIKLAGTFQDVTEIVQKEQDLKHVLNNITEGYWDWYIEQDYEYMSPRFWEMLGYNPIEKRHHPSEWQKLIHPDDLEKTLANFNLHKLSHGEKPFRQEVRYLHGSGKYIWIKCEGKIIEWSQNGNPIRMVGTHHDIDSEKKLLNEVSESKKYLDLAIEGANLGIWDWNLVDNSVKYSEQWAKLRGLELEDLAMNLSDWESRVHPKDLPIAYQNIQNYLEGRTSYFEHIHRIKHEDGHWVYILGRGRYSAWDDSGKPIRFTGTDMDITDLMTNKMKLDLFFNNAPFGFAFCDVNGKFLEINHELTRITGYEKKELNELSYWDLTPKKYEAEEKIQLEKIHKTGAYGPYKKEYLKKNGELIPVKLSGFMVEDYDGQKGIWSIIEDITVQVSLEEEIDRQKKYSMHQARLASIGELAAGVGHEINNPLAIVKGQLELTKRLIEKGQFDSNIILEKIQKADTGIDRIANIVKGLRSFARADEEDKTQTNLTDLVNSTVDLVREIYSKMGIEIVLNLEPQVSIFCHKGRMQQVLMNLLSNARDAVEQQVTKRIDINLSCLQDRIELVISDCGAGIPNELKSKIFDAFFTTKPINKGTGIGLSIVYSIIKEHGGDIMVNNNANGGAEFKILLESSNEKSESKLPNDFDQSVKTDPSVQSSILIVEDEEDIRDLYVSMLEDYGLTIKTAANAMEAIDLFKKELKFDLLITDYLMPKMNGIELITKIKDDFSFKGKVCLATGGVQMLENGFHHLVDDVLMKPFSHEDLKKIIDRLL
jgi:PAS domain S-box-containing protein